MGEDILVLRIPRRAIERQFELDYVYVLDRETDSGSIAVASRRRVSVRPVPFRPDLMDVSEGLEPGDSIASSGLRDLRDGTRVVVESGSSPMSARR